MNMNASIDSYVEKDERKALRDYNSDYGVMMTLSNDKEVKDNE